MSSIQFQTLLGDSSGELNSLDVQDLAANTATVQNLAIPTGAQKGLVLTSDDKGNGSWVAAPDSVLGGDASGPSGNNAVNSLAGGTIPVSTVVQLDKEQTLTNKTLIVPAVNSVASVGTILNMPVITDTLVSRTSVDTLFNKTITGTTNSVDANTLRSGSVYAVPLGGAAPAPNNILTYDGTNAVWQAAPSTSSVAAGATFTNNGTFTNISAFNGATPVNGTGIFQNGNATLFSGYIINNAGGIINNDGIFKNNQSGKIYNRGTIANGGLLMNSYTDEQEDTYVGTIQGGNITGAAISGGTITGVAVTGNDIRYCNLYDNSIMPNFALFNNGTINNTNGTISGGAITGAALTDCTFTGGFPSSTFNNPTFTGDAITISPLSQVICKGGINVSGDYSGINNFGFYYTQAGGNMDNNGTFYNTAKFVNRYNTGFMWNAGTFTNNWNDAVNSNGYYGFKGGVIDNSGGTIKNGSAFTSSETVGIFDNTYGTISGGKITGATITGGSLSASNVTITGGTISAANMSNVALTGSTITNSAITNSTVSGALTSTGVLFCNNQIQNQVICLYQEGGSPSAGATSYYGFGINGGVLRHQVPGSSSHKFYADTTELASISSSGLQLSGGLTLPTSGGTASPLNYYEEYTHVTNFTYGSQNTTAATFRVVRVGKLVTMTMLTGSQYVDSTSSNHFYSAVNLPMRFVGGVGVMVPIVVISGGLYATGSFSLDNQAGAFGVHLNYNLPFPASSSVGFIAFTSSWCI